MKYAYRRGPVKNGWFAVGQNYRDICLVEKRGKKWTVYDYSHEIYAEGKTRDEAVDNYLQKLKEAAGGSQS